jgi:hypothetical protein
MPALSPVSPPPAQLEAYGTWSLPYDFV